MLWEDPPRSVECSSQGPASLLPAADQEGDLGGQNHMPELDEYRSRMSVAS